MKQIGIKSKDNDNWSVYEFILQSLSEILNPQDRYTRSDLVEAINQLLPVVITLSKKDPMLVGYCVVSHDMVLVDEEVTAYQNGKDFFGNGEFHVLVLRTEHQQRIIYTV